MRDIIKKILKEETSKRVSENHPLVRGIKNLFNNKKFEIKYFTPYGFYDSITVIVDYYVKNVAIWKTNYSDYYEGTIYIGIKSMKFMMGEVSETVHESSEVNHQVWDGLVEEIMDKLTKFVPIFQDEEGEYTIDIDFPDEW
jgi:hypothetical protein